MTITWENARKKTKFWKRSPPPYWNGFFPRLNNIPLYVEGKGKDMTVNETCICIWRMRCVFVFDEWDVCIFIWRSMCSFGIGKDEKIWGAMHVVITFWRRLFIREHMNEYTQIYGEATQIYPIFTHISICIQYIWMNTQIYPNNKKKWQQDLETFNPIYWGYDGNSYVCNISYWASWKSRN